MTKDPNYGRILADRYRLVELAGKGAMGRVYRAEDTLLGEVSVAVKFLAQTLLNDKMRERFEREATICALLGETTIHVVRVRDYGIDQDDVPYYVMEFLQGESLGDILKTSIIPLHRFFPILRQICLGMEAAHRGIHYKGELCPIIHRDIKPSNVLILKDSTLGELVKILDFGIAKLQQSDSNQTHSFMGTLAYCSPEQMEGRELDQRSDIYSLGIMMYEMLTGEMPIYPENTSFGGWYKAHHFGQPNPFDPSLKIPEEVQAVVRHCLAKKPEDRPQNAIAIWRQLEAIQEKLHAHPMGPEPSPPPVAAPEPSPQQPNKDKNKGEPTIPIVPPELLTHSSRPSIPADLPQPEEPLVVSSVYALGAIATWPPNKPRQKIVFPRLVHTSETVLPTLWVMLDLLDISSRRNDTRYNQFMFLELPHPMLLWITVLFNPEQGPRWLPCYLDLKSVTGQRIVRALGEQGLYRILVFALEAPETAEIILSSRIASPQCQKLLDWANHSQNIPSSNPNVSKQALRQEFEKMKPKIILKLESYGQASSVEDSLR